MKIVKVVILFILTISIIGSLVFYTKRWMMTSPLFHVRTVKVVGNELVSEKTILTLLNIKNEIHIFKVNIDSLENKLSTNPFIKNVSVKRIFPSTISVSLKEKHPLAFVISKKNYLLSDSKELLPMPEQIRVYDLPTITGIMNIESRFKKKEDIPELNKIVDILYTLQKPDIDLYYEISEIYYRNKEMSVLYLYDKAIPVYMNNTELEETLFRFKQFLAYSKSSNFLKKIKYVNLCYKNQVIIKE